MKPICTLFFFLLLGNCFAQNGSRLFDDSYIHTLQLHTPNVHWFDTLSLDYQLNAKNPKLYPEIYRYASLSIDGTMLDSIGFRQKGNSSNSFLASARKKPMKIAFDAFKNERYDGLKKVNLNVFTNDPSLLHEVTAYKLFRDAGIAASRTAYCKVWVNDEYIGLYLLVEQVDKTFLKQHYGGGQNNEGNLYKTDRGASVFLNDLGTNQQAYKNQGLKLTTNEGEDDFSGLIRFIQFLNQPEQAYFQDSLEKRFDVHNYLKILAIEKCVRNWDSYWGGGNNFYLYEHPDGQFRWIPWDVNETFQSLKIFEKTTALDGYLIPSKNRDERPLLKAIFDIEAYKMEYLQYCCDLANGLFSLDHLGRKMYEWHALVDTAYQNDPNKSNTYAAFAHSLTRNNTDEVLLSKMGMTVRLRYPGLFPFIEEQQQWIQKQLAAWEVECKLPKQTQYELAVFPNPVTTELWVSCDTSRSQLADFEVYDMTGRKVLHIPMAVLWEETYKIDVASLSAGWYTILKKDVNGNIGRTKFVKLP